MGLWVMAGSWCADNLTDGWLPDYIAMRLDRDYEQNAKALVQVGLWIEEVRDGEEGWRFHEWNEPGRQPTKEQVLADRAANADRQKRARDRAKEKRDQETSQRESRDHNGVTAPITNGVSNAAVTGAVTVPPTRPDPTRTSYGSKTPLAAGAATQDTFAGMPEPPPPAIQANDVIKAFVETCAAAGQDKPTSVVIKRIGKDAKRLIEEEKVEPSKVVAAGEFIAKEGWQSLDSGLRRLSAENSNYQGRRGGNQHSPYQDPEDLSRYHTSKL